MTGFSPVRTLRLELRTLETADSAAFFAYRSDSRVSRFQSFRPKEEAEAAAFIARIPGEFGIRGTWYQLGIYAGKRLVGDLGVHFLEADGLQCELGYTLAPAEQGKGYAREAVRGLLACLFEDHGCHRAIASVDPRNAPSIALLEGLGFRKEGHFVKSILVDGAWEDDLRYGMLSEEWKAKGRGLAAAAAAGCGRPDTKALGPDRNHAGA